MDYWHYAWACPYFVWDDKNKIGCANKCYVSFTDPRLLQRYAKKYCASITGYPRCGIAAMNEEIYYEKLEKEKILNEARQKASGKG